MNGDENHRETLERERRLTAAFKQTTGRNPATNDTVDAEGGRWQYGEGIGWWLVNDAIEDSRHAPPR